MSPDCVCGHQGGDHRPKPPFQCTVCSCVGYHEAPAPAAGERGSPENPYQFGGIIGPEAAPPAASEAIRPCPRDGCRITAIHDHGAEGDFALYDAPAARSTEEGVDAIMRDYIGTCACDSAWTDRGRHAPDCVAGETEGVRDAILAYGREREIAEADAIESAIYSRLAIAAVVGHAERRAVTAVIAEVIAARREGKP